MDIDIREDYIFKENGHVFHVLPSNEMGGGISGVSLYCLTCDDGDKNYLCVGWWDFWNWPDVKTYTHNEAYLEMRKAAWKHAHPERVKNS